MEGGGLEHMVLSIAACAIAVLLGLSAFAAPGRSERSSPMFVLATPPEGTYFDFVVSILMENHGICDILTYCGGSAPFETQLANASGLATNYSPSPCGKSLADYLCLTGASTFGCTENPIRTRTPAPGSHGSRPTSWTASLTPGSRGRRTWRT